MRLGSLTDLIPATTRVVVVNVATDLVATRALLSATELTPFPVLLVNCGPTPGSTRHFDALMRSYRFDVVDGPVSHHGRFLDHLFATSVDESLLLLDSDAEIRDIELAGWMARMLSEPATFGAGFLEGPFWMGTDWQAPEQTMLYMERPWVPCVLLEVAAVRRALAAGRSFGELMVPNEVAFAPRVAWFLASRFGPPYGPSSPTLQRLPGPVRDWIAHRRLDFLTPVSFPYYGLRPKIACYDTAGRIYEYLRFQEGGIFAGTHIAVSEGRVHHYGGITRNRRYGPTKLDRSEADVASDAERCLREHYHLSWEPV